MTDELDKIIKMYDAGVITKAELDAHKKALAMTHTERYQGKYRTPWQWYDYCFQRTFITFGRATRAEFFSFSILNLMIIFLSMIGIFFMSLFTHSTLIISIMLSVFAFYLLITTITQSSLYIRRFHDKNKSALFAFLPTLMYISAAMFVIFPTMMIFIFMVANIMALMWTGILFLKGSKGENDYGNEVINFMPKSIYSYSVFTMFLGIIIVLLPKIFGNYPIGQFKHIIRTMLQYF